MTIASSSIANATGTITYTSSGNTVITWLSITNYTASDATVNLHIVNSGGSANSINQVISNVLVTAGDTLQLYTGAEKVVLNNGDFVRAIANASTTLNCVTSYAPA
jgi:hypothetical protein